MGKKGLLKGSPSGVAKNPLKKTGKNKDNCHAIIWRIKSPANIIYKFKNASQFIRDNPDLFDKDDLVWVDSGCRASRGLLSLNRVNVFSWKGWTGYGEA